MDGEGTEAARMFGVQIVDDQLRQIDDVGPTQPGENVPSQRGIELVGEQPIEGGLLVIVGPLLPSAQGIGRQRLARNRSRIQSGGQVRRAPLHDLLVVEMQPQPVLEIGERAIRIFFVTQQRVPSLNFGESGRLIEALMPRRVERNGFVVLLGIQIMQAVEVVIIFRSGNELLERLGPIPSQGEFLDEADVGRLDS